MSHVLNDFNQSPSSALPDAFASPSAPPSTPLAPSPTDLNILVSMSQDIAQVLLKYGISEPYTESKTKAKTKDKAKDKKSSKKEHAEHLEQGDELGEQLEQPEQGESGEPSEKEQSITFSYNTEGKRTPTFFKMYGDTLEQYRQGEFHDEIRCFHLSESKVREERELLEKHNCVHLAEFLYQTHDELSMFVNLLCSVDNGIILPAKVLQQAFYKMELLLEKLEELHTHMENYEQVHTESVHTELINTAVIPE